MSTTTATRSKNGVRNAVSGAAPARSVVTTDSRRRGRTFNVIALVVLILFAIVWLIPSLFALKAHLGEIFASRHSVSHMSNAGLSDWVAPDVPAYIELAAKKASDIEALAALRLRLRAQVKASPLCDAPRFGQRGNAPKPLSHTDRHRQLLGLPLTAALKNT